MRAYDILECLVCGDSCGEAVCYGCQDTADDMGLNIYDLFDNYWEGK